MGMNIYSCTRKLVRLQLAAERTFLQDKPAVVHCSKIYVNVGI